MSDALLLLEETAATWETSNGERTNVELHDGRTGSGWSLEEAIAVAKTNPLPACQHCGCTDFYSPDGEWMGEQNGDGNGRFAYSGQEECMDCGFYTQVRRPWILSGM